MIGVLTLVTASLAFFAGGMAVAAFYWRRDFLAELSLLTSQVNSIKASHLALSKLDLESINRRLGELEMRARSGR
jgi:hypothetical protein